MNQLVLDELGFPEERTLENFVAGDNQTSLDRLATVDAGAAEFRLIWLAGARGTGKSHLAEAACRAARAWPQGYFAWHDWSHADRQAHLAGLAFVAIDDIDKLLGDREPEQWLMYLIDVRRRQRLPTLLTSADGPRGVGFALADLRTRIGLAEVLWLEALSDEVKIGVMSEYAAARGFQLSAEVLKFILARHNRNLGRLIALLRRIDRYALAHQRPVTVPLVREVLEQADDGGR